MPVAGLESIDLISRTVQKQFANFRRHQLGRELLAKSGYEILLPLSPVASSRVSM